MSASTMPSANGITAHAASAGASASIGAMKNSERLAPVGTMISLKISLKTSANGCSRPERPDAVRADAHLHPADDLALGERQVGDAEDQRHGDDDDLHQRPDDRPRGAEQRLRRCQQRVERIHATRAPR